MAVPGMYAGARMNVGDGDLVERLLHFGAGHEATEEAAKEILSLRKNMDDAKDRIDILMDIITAFEMKFPGFVYRHQTNTVEAE